ncbi:nucleotide-binding domain-containing protein [Parathielavia hyrcaniae]|uniref:Nucleotide-binding domain-containing protein n=1 Tax=Parathielavia hyrcaniae TaxID=113614 RepID=A0AAN6Q0Z3_9PEZI|nr:nucleotide-binding domain-containing protein [Parathielavia hyrcaniae]
MPRQVRVIGGGIIGLSCAHLLQKAGYAVTIIARDFPAPFETTDPIAKINYTSPWGGAHNRWVPPHPSLPAHFTRDHALSLRTYTHMQRLHATHPHTAGITFLKGIEYLERPGPEYLALSTPSSPNALDLPGFRLLAPSDLLRDGRVTWGCEYDTWCVNPMVYCSFLLRRFVHRGGKVVTREVTRPEEVFSMSLDEGGLAPAPDSKSESEKKGEEEKGEEEGIVAAVVNASGTGLVPDPDMTVTRGQTVLVAEGCDATVTRQNADGSWTFCVPRGFDGGTVIGGTKELNNWDVKPSAEVREELLRKFTETYPNILGGGGGGGKRRLTVLRDIVGRRPTRNGGPRIEGELVPGAGFVMHAYGLGGRGYELSWGVAEAVVEGIEKHVNGEESKS